MLQRIVKMTFQPDRIDDFLTVFAESSPHIRARKGCHHLELWRAHDPDNVIFTYSHWESAEDLDAYRDSDLFRTTWAKTKVLFADRPAAWSVNTLEQLP